MSKLLCVVCGKDSCVSSGFHLGDLNSCNALNFCGHACIADFIEALDKSIPNLLIEYRRYIVILKDNLKIKVNSE